MLIKHHSHIDRALTDMSIAYIQDDAQYVARKYFPIRNTTMRSDIYFIYPKGDWYRDEATERGILEESSGSNFGVDTSDPYYCKKYAHHTDISEEDRIADAPINTDLEALEFVEGKIKIKLEKDFANTFFKTGVWSNDYSGAAATNYGSKELEYWSRSTSRPVAQIKYLATQMQMETGKRPNKMLMGRKVLDILTEHTDLIGRFIYTETGMVDLNKLSMLFGLQVEVADGIVNTGKRGQSDSMSFIFDPESVLLSYNAPRMGVRTVTSGCVIGWTGLKGSNALGGRSLRIPLPLLGEGAERIESEIAYDFLVIASDLGIFIENIIE